MKNKKLAFLLLGLLGFLANGDNYAASALIPNIAEDLGLTVTSATASVTAYMATYGIFTLIFGPLSDRFGKVRIINIAAIGTAIFSMLSALSFNLPSLVAFRALNGVFGAGIFPITVALVGEMFSDNKRQGAVAKFMSIGFLGGAMATAIGGSISYLGSWRLVYFSYGLAEFILSIVILFILKPDKGTVKELHFISFYKDAVTDKKFMRFAGLIFFIGISVLGTFTYIGTYIIQETSLNILIVGIILSLYGLGAMIGGKYVIAFRKKNPKTFMIFAGILGTTSLVLIGFSGQIVFMALGLALFGAAYITLQITIVSTGQHILSHRKGTAMSVMAFNMFLGAAVGTQINGIIIDKSQMSSVFITGSILLILVGLVGQLLVTKFDIRQNELKLKSEEK